MIQITDKQDGQKKLRRSYEDYIPLETPETSEPQETETTEPTETQPSEPTTEPTEVETEEKTEENSEML